MNRILIHRLSGNNAWWQSKREYLHVDNITNIFYYKRMFCLAQQKEPFSLIIQYQDKQSFIMHPMHLFRNIQTIESKFLNIRFKTLDECVKEYNSIVNKMKID